MKIKVKGKLLTIHSPLNLWTKICSREFPTKYFPTNFIDYIVILFNRLIISTLSFNKKAPPEETLLHGIVIKGFRYIGLSNFLTIPGGRWLFLARLFQQRRLSNLRAIIGLAQTLFPYRYQKSYNGLF